MSLRGIPVDNDGFVNAGDIGVGEDALLCLTNATNCCAGSNRMGDWYFPNGTVVASFGDNGGSIHNNFFSIICTACMHACMRAQIECASDDRPLPDTVLCTRTWGDPLPK